MILGSFSRTVFTEVMAVVRIESMNFIDSMYGEAKFSLQVKVSFITLYAQMLFFQIFVNKLNTLNI